MPRTKLQYQAVTGPVFTGIVAATLAWLPSGNCQPTRSRLPIQVQQGTVQPFTQALYKMERLEWIPKGNPQPRRALDPIQSQQGMVGPFVEATRYRWERLEWIPKGHPQPTRGLQPIQSQQGMVGPFVEATRYRWERLEWIPKGNEFVRSLRPIQPQGNAVQPFTAALYVPERVEWIPKGNIFVRGRSPNLLGWVVLNPLPVTPSFDPATLGWQPTGNTRVFVYSQYQFQEVSCPVPVPDTAAPLAWLPAGRVQPLRGLFRGVPTWGLLDPFPVPVPFDPRLFPVTPLPVARSLLHGVPTWGLLDPLPPPAVFDPRLFPVTPPVLWRERPRSLVREFVEPFVAALYRPERLEWIPLGRQPWRGLPPNQLGCFVGDSLPHPNQFTPMALFYTDESGCRFVFTDESTTRLTFLDQSVTRLTSDDDSGVA